MLKKKNLVSITTKLKKLIRLKFKKLENLRLKKKKLDSITIKLKKLIRLKFKKLENLRFKLRRFKKVKNVTELYSLLLSFC